MRGLTGVAPRCNVVTQRVTTSSRQAAPREASSRERGDAVRRGPKPSRGGSRQARVARLRGTATGVRAAAIFSAAGERERRGALRGCQAARAKDTRITLRGGRGITARRLPRARAHVAPARPLFCAGYGTPASARCQCTPPPRRPPPLALARPCAWPAAAARLLARPAARSLRAAAPPGKGWRRALRAAPGVYRGSAGRRPRPGRLAPRASRAVRLPGYTRSRDGAEAPEPRFIPLCKS